MNVDKIYNILHKPYVTEKTAISSGDCRQYAFKVSTDATKPQIKLALKSLFNVNAKSIRIINVKNKKKRFKNQLGARSGWKKAYVTLSKNEEIDLTN